MLLKVRFILILFLFGFFVGNSALADRDAYCKLKTNEIEVVANKILTRSHEMKKDFPMSSVIQSNFNGQLSDDDKKSNLEATLEGFIRVEESGQFSILPLSIPLFAVNLNKERDIVYVCAHLDPDPAKYFLEIYFLTGYNLGDVSMRSFLGDLIFDSVSVTPVVINPLSLDQAVNFFGGNVGEMDLFKLLMTPLRVPLAVVSQAQSLLMSSLDSIFPIGIEKVLLTQDEVVLSSDVDLKNPKKSTFHYHISLKAK
jgi:hypothetical protein